MRTDPGPALESTLEDHRGLLTAVGASFGGLNQHNNNNNLRRTKDDPYSTEVLTKIPGGERGGAILKTLPCSGRPGNTSSAVIKQPDVEELTKSHCTRGKPDRAINTCINASMHGI